MSNDKLMMSDIRDDTLTHYGVLGMKWGVRKDRKRTRTSSNTSTPTSSGETVKTVQKIKKKPRTIKDISNTQLRETNERLRLEAEYNRLMSDVKKANRSKSKKFIQDRLVPASTKIVENLATEYGKSFIKSQIQFPEPKKKKNQK